MFIIKFITMKYLVILATTLATISGLNIEEEWNNFKVKYAKSYISKSEENNRFNIFQKNFKIIKEHNAKYEAGLSTYWMDINKFSDLTTKEFVSKVGLKQNNQKGYFKKDLYFPQNISTPDSIDWREKGAVLDVKNERGCASSWAFSATGALEGQNAIINNKKVSLSEQQLIDCSKEYGNGDCGEGGSVEGVFQYVTRNGIQSERGYPFRAKRGDCHDGMSVLAIKGYKLIEKSEEALKEAVGTIGPIAAEVFSKPFRHYGGGIFDDITCISQRSLLDNAVLVVGYETYPSEYWIIKNSLGTDWGEKGYLRMSRNKNLCGVHLEASYPVL